MDMFTSLMPPHLWAIAVIVAVLAGTIKGMVGFAFPMVMISVLGSFLEPELALAALIIPTLVSNAVQALRQGWRAAVESVTRFRVFLLAMMVMLVLSAQMVRFLAPSTLLLMIGVPVSFFAALQLLRVRLHIARPSARIEVAAGAFAGAIGGVSGVWGPPTVTYLTALNTDKRDQMRVQGVIYSIGAVGLVLAHIGSGVLRAETLPLSLAMVPPAIIGMWIGGRFHDAVDQGTFRKATLAVLLIAALNLIRRALLG